MKVIQPILTQWDACAALNIMAKKLVKETRGTAIPSMAEGANSMIDHVKEYYGIVVSHRVEAELLGVGWCMRLYSITGNSAGNT